MTESKDPKRPKSSPLAKIGSLEAFSKVDPHELLTALEVQSTKHERQEVMGRIRDLRTKLGQSFLGRHVAIDGVLASLMSGVPAVLLGPPGTAKSSIIKMISRRTRSAESAQSSFFEYLLSQHTMPEEIFGPPMIQELRENNRFKRETKNMLPEAEFAFLDEVFRGGSHILNTLLTIVNEREFHNGVEKMTVPLVGVLAASNDPPLDPELAAFYDRFPLRIWVESVFDDTKVTTTDSQRVQSLLEVEQKLAKLARRDDEPLVCVNDFRFMQAVIERARIDTLIAGDLLQRLFLKFRRSNLCELSDRTLFPIAKVALALHFLRGERETKTSQEEAVRTAFQFVAPSRELARQISDELEGQFGLQHTGRQ